MANPITKEIQNCFRLRMKGDYPKLPRRRLSLHSDFPSFSPGGQQQVNGAQPPPDFKRSRPKEVALYGMHQGDVLHGENTLMTNDRFVIVIMSSTLRTAPLPYCAMRSDDVKWGLNQPRGRDLRTLTFESRVSSHYVNDFRFGWTT